MSGNTDGSDEAIPPLINTAHLLLRGLIPAFLGCPMGDDAGAACSAGVRPSAFQMTYRKDLPRLGSVNGELRRMIL